MTAATVPMRRVGRPRSNKCDCGRALRQETDGRGGVIDVCPVHGSNTGDPDDRCKVAGCPGRPDHNGTCSCCDKRKAFERENLPPKSCEICGGDISGTGRKKARTKYCAACAPLVKRIYQHQRELTRHNKSGS